MKTAISILLMWAITSAYASDPLIKNPVPGSPKGATGFKLVKQRNDISIFTRWIPVDENRSARQVKVEFTINAPADSALSVILDDDSFPKWITDPIIQNNMIRTMSAFREQVTSN